MEKSVRQIKFVSHISPVDGEITLKFGNGKKYVLCIQSKDYYTEFVHMSAHLYCTNGKKMHYYADFDWSILFKIPYKVVRKTDVLSLQYTKILEVNLFAFAYRLFHRFFSNQLGILHEISIKQSVGKCKQINF